MFTKAGWRWSLCCDSVCGGGAEREQWRLLHSLPFFQSLPPPPIIKLGPSGADSRVGGLVHTLGPCGSLQRTLPWGWESLLLPPNPPQVFSIGSLRLYFPALEPWVAVVCFTPPWFLPVYLGANVGPQGPPATTLWGLPAAAWPAPLPNPPPRWVCQPPPCHESSLPQLTISAPPFGLGECFFFISLVVWLPCSLTFYQFWMFFVFKLLLSFFWLWKEAQCVYLHLLLGRIMEPRKILIVITLNVQKI